VTRTRRGPPRRLLYGHLKGISTPSVEDITPVRPIFVMDKNDSRIVKERDVAQELEPEANLVAMPWEDFEHLVRQLYEWEFGKTGAEAGSLARREIAEWTPSFLILIRSAEENLSYRRKNILVPSMSLLYATFTAPCSMKRKSRHSCYYEQLRS
jgi:hypothetical protein